MPSHVAEHGTTQWFLPRAPERYSCYMVSTKPHESCLLPILDFCRGFRSTLHCQLCTHRDTGQDRGRQMVTPPPPQFVSVNAPALITSLNKHISRAKLWFCSRHVRGTYYISCSVLFSFTAYIIWRRDPPLVKIKDCPTVGGICIAYILQGRAQHFILQNSCRARIFYMSYTSSLPQCRCCFFP